MKLIHAAEVLNMSVSGLLVELVRRMEIREDGAPVWAPEHADAEELPLSA